MSYRYSADVDMYLQAGTDRIDVVSCFDNTCVLAHPLELSPMEAELVIVVDGTEWRKLVLLHAGATAASPEVQYSVPGVDDLDPIPF
jgi:hypothetical protein